MRLIMKQFMIWLTASNHADKIPMVEVLQAHVKDTVDEEKPKQCEAVMNSECFKDIHLLWVQYLQHLRSDNGQLSCFRMSMLILKETYYLD